MSRGYVTYVIEENIAVIAIDNPPVNSLNSKVTRELSQTFDELKLNDEIQSVVLTAKGKAFAAGADIKSFLELDRNKGEYYALAVTDMQRKIEEEVVAEALRGREMERPISETEGLFLT